jgi:hypothetical protein
LFLALYVLDIVIFRVVFAIQQYIVATPPSVNQKFSYTSQIHSASGRNINRTPGTLRQHAALIGAQDFSLNFRVCSLRGTIRETNVFFNVSLKMTVLLRGLMTQYSVLGKQRPTCLSEERSIVFAYSGLRNGRKVVDYAYDMTWKGQAPVRLVIIYTSPCN